MALRRRHAAFFCPRNSLDAATTAAAAEEERKETEGRNAGEDESRKSKKKEKKKGRKGKKGKKKGSEQDRAALQLFLDRFRGTRRLMVRSFALPRRTSLSSSPRSSPPPGDLHTQHGGDAVHPAEGGAPEAPVPAGRQEGDGGHHGGPGDAHAAPPPAR